MAPSASSVTSVRLETGREQLPVSPAPALTEQPTATRHNRLRALEAAECSLCGIALPLGLLVPDGGQACADIRWYCKDAMSCTKRWTAARAPGRVHTPTARDGAFAGTGQVAPDGAPSEQPGSWFEEARSAV